MFQLSALFLGGRAGIAQTGNFFVDQTGTPQDYVMEIWDNSNGLPQNNVLALEKDNSGYLWIATEEGLVRFDGNSPKIFDEDTYPEMLEQTYYAFFKTPGGIWATGDRSIALLEKNIKKVIDCTEITKKTWIRAVAEDDNGGLLIGTQKGEIYSWKNNSFSLLDFWTPAAQLEIFGFFALEDSKLLVGTSRGLYELDLRSKQTTLVSPESLSFQKVFGSAGSTYLYSPDSGIYRLKENYEREQLISYEQSKGINPSSLTVDSENRIWAESLEKGLIMIEDGAITPFTYPEIKNYPIRKILTEDENLYLGTVGRGLALVKSAKVNQLNFEALKEKNIKAIFQGSDSSMWIGTKSFGLYRIKAGKVSNLTTDDGLINSGIITVGASKDRIYAGTASGITVIDAKSGEVIDRLTQEDGLKSNYTYAVYRDSKDWLWILTRSGGIQYIDENDTLRTVELPETYSNTNFISVLELKNGQIVIGSMNQGIFRIEDGKLVQNQTLPLTPGEDIIYGMYEDESDDLWFGTHGGLVLLNDGNFKLLKKRNGLKSRSVYSIIGDGLNGVWISNNFGVQYLAKSELERFKETTDSDFFIAATFYDKSQGMPNSEANGLIFPALLKDFSGKIWIPTVEGVGVVDPTKISEKAIVPARFFWDELQTGDKKTPIRDEVAIPEGVRMFGISFSLVDFENPSQYSLFYRIDDSKDLWFPIKDQRQVIFNGVKPGRYTLEVKVLRHGKLDQVQSLPLVVSASLTETTAFRFFLAAAFCLLVYFIVKFYFNIKLKNNLESLVNQRTSELTYANEQLTDALREIADQNTILKEVTWRQSHLFRAPLTKAMGINLLMIKYPAYTRVGKSKEQLELELLETLKQLDEIVKETHAKSENLIKG